MTVDEMIVLKKKLGYSYEMIAERSGIPLSTVQKVFSKATPNPRYATLRALSDVFEGTGTTGLFDEDGEPCSVVCEDMGTYKAFSGTGALNISSYENKTIEDYLALPEGTRVELIDGVFYDMAAPTSIHQYLIHQLSFRLELFVQSNKGTCLVLPAPTDVQLDCDDKTMVQPDVLVVCNRDRITKSRIVGAPDFAIEILSESNWYNDVFRKLIKYKNAGVREYWIVMPEKKKIQVYFFERSDTPSEYSFADKVPVNIWNGKLTIDFSEIDEKINYWME